MNIRYKNLIYAAGGILGLMLIIFVIYPFVIKVINSGNVPAMPSLNGYEDFITEQIQNYNDIAEDDPTSSQKIGELGMVYHSNFFYDEAIDCYNSALRLDNSQWKWNYYLALIAEQLGDTEGSTKNLKLVVEKNPQNSIAWFRLGNAYLKQDELDKSEAAFNKVISTYNSNGKDDGESFSLVVYAELNIARVNSRSGENDKAINKLENLIKLSPRFGPAYRLLGQLYNEEGNELKGAELITVAGDFESYQPPEDEIFDKLVLYSRNSEFILKQIDIARKKGNYNWAKRLCNYTLSFNPNDINAITKTIIVKLETSDTDGLESNINSCFNHYSNDEDNLIGVAKTLNRWGQNNHALKFLHHAIDLNPEAIDAHVLILKIESRKADKTRLFEKCEKLLKIAPDNSDVNTEVGRIFALYDQKQRGIKHLKIAAKQNPQNEIPLILLGIIEQENNNPNSALAYYNKAIKANPLNINSIIKTVNYLFELKKWREAKNLLEKSLIDSPNSVELLERYARLLAASPNSKIRDTQKALNYAERISLIRKITPQLHFLCSITIAITYAANNNFQSAINLLLNTRKQAVSLNHRSFLAEVDKLGLMFQERKAFRL